MRIALSKRKLPDSAQWANFLRNHDELDIGRLPDEQKQKVFAEFGPEKRMQLYDRGIRRRLAPMLGGDRRRLELANSIMMTLPGTPVIRYGDEIGMGDDLALPERDCARTPMQWSGGTNGGFTASDDPVRPPIAEGAYSYRELNVADQRTDAASLLNWSERVIRLRKELPEIGRGDFTILDTPPGILAIRYDWQGRASIFVHNLEDRRVESRIATEAPGDAPLVCLWSDAVNDPDADGRFSLVLEPYGYRWLRFGGLDGWTG